MFPVAPNIWTDGSREPIPHLDVETAGAGAFVHSPAIIFDSHHWGHAQDLDDPHEGSSHIFSGALGPIQSVQRAEYCCVILALQAYSGIHIGIDNLNVLRGVAALLSHKVPRSPLPLMKDGDLLATIHSMLSLRGFDTVKVSKVKGHATRAMVDSGDVRLEDLVGNNGADAAADLGRLRQQDAVITARRDLLRVRRFWYPIILDLHKFMVAISRIEVNHDGFGGTAPDAMVWGDLLATIHSMLSLRGFSTVKVSKVKGHATRAMVASGDVRLEDLVGNNGADAAADLGLLRHHDDVITARRDLLRVRRLWYPVMLDLHRFMVAISRIEVNHDGFGGTAPDAMVWDKGGIVKTRAPSFRLIVDHATLPGPPGFLSSTWCTLYSLPITHDDVAVWPYSVDILLVLSSFLASLHWPQGTPDLGKFGISYFELLLMFEVYTGHRLHTEKVVRPHFRPSRRLVFSGLSVGLGQEIRHGCHQLNCLCQLRA